MQEAPTSTPFESVEALPSFQVIEHHKTFNSFEKKPDFIDNTIIHCRYEFDPMDSRDAFYLRSPIGSHRFILRLVASGHEQRSYSLQSEIEGYGFAIANLDEDEREQLFKVRAGFIESVSTYTDDMQSIESSTHENPYTIDDIEGCIAEILQHPNNRQTAEELRNLAATYVINQIFELYQDLFGESYFEDTLPESKAIARKRLFAAKFKKYLKTWEVVDIPLSTIYQLKRKATS
jgi:hypothetical protein